MSQSTNAFSAWYRPMRARHAGEEHRAASALELFFDLCFVAAVAQASSAFEHEIASGRAGHGLVGYALVFFAIWWAWMNFTWFASAYDTDDVPYRLLTLIQIIGALVMASGAAEALEHGDFTLITWGYVVMRLAMVSQWLRAACTDRERRRSALRYAVGILVLQVGWLVRLALPVGGSVAGSVGGGTVTFAVLAVLELAVPVWAERAEGTTWHPQHIAERYGLFTLIVLGESVMAAGLAVGAALDTHKDLGSVLPVALGGLLTVFALWWMYFAQDAPRRLRTQRTAMLWGYGHYVVFAAAAAVGAALAVNVAHVTGSRALTDVRAAAVYTVPVALFVTCVWLLHRRAARLSTAADVLPPAAALAVLCLTFTPFAVLGTGVVASLLVAGSVVLGRHGRADE
ncbi:low temperature requirement protein A [Streptomyces longispororuber]|uniref:low temperature requirement protein A n=1 Tax=Streptomyces longispororuber TaxID=68230 RepID=UPI00210DF1EE|nr:low temperature requirement protein A [Streptomyces longispororuber]MCQ4210556.1 low temperature requirement protein A [Streptomyces longispororuber]